MELKNLSDSLAVPAAIVSSLSTLLIPCVRAWVTKVGKGVWMFFRSPFVIVEQNKLLAEKYEETARMVKSSATQLDALSSVVKDISYQVHTNDGGSVKDAVNRTEKSVKALTESLSELTVSNERLERWHQNHFWSQPRPGLELDNLGCVNLVSEAACRLFQVADQNQLTKLSWLQFISSKSAHDFLRAFKDTAETDSMFRCIVVVKDQSGGDRGTWEFKATPIGQRMYSGYFSPVDEPAVAIAARNSWLH